MNFAVAHLLSSLPGLAAPEGWVKAGIEVDQDSSGRGAADPSSVRKRLSKSPECASR